VSSAYVPVFIVMAQGISFVKNIDRGNRRGSLFGASFSPVHMALPETVKRSLDNDILNYKSVEKPSFFFRHPSLCLDPNGARPCNARRIKFHLAIPTTFPS